MSDKRAELIKFRELLYRSFPRRKDAIVELLDANSASNGLFKRVVQLCKSRFFTRQYPSITDALTDGLEVANWPMLQKLMWRFGQSEGMGYHRFIVDCTPRDRLYSRKMQGRSIVHKPNPAPGNKPICAGHQYSVVAYAPPGNSAERKRWLVPLSTQRVPHDEKGNQFGMSQLTDVVKNLGLEGEVVVSIGDRAYSTAPCHQEMANSENRIHIARLRSTRNVFELYQGIQGKGRKKLFGRKMSLSNPDTHLPHDEEVKFCETSRKDKLLNYTIKAWNSLVFRGSMEFKAHEHPFRLVQLTSYDDQQKTVFNKPMWLVIFGKKRHQMTLKACVDSYRDRYDIEHYFRFGKQRLMMDTFQTSEAEHDEAWWNLCALAYFQLFLSKDFADATPEPWERFLSEFKNMNNHEVVSASVAQRGFEKILQQIGSPAKEPVPRGNPLGRKQGQSPGKKLEAPVHFKNNRVNKPKLAITSGKENINQNHLPQNIDDLLNMLTFSLDKMGVSVEDFCKTVLNST